MGTEAHFNVDKRQEVGLPDWLSQLANLTFHTGADFYVGKGQEMKWIGSIGIDGDPTRIADAILSAKTERDFIDAVMGLLAKRDDATLPEHGWPWSWDFSGTTDYTYAFFDGGVKASWYGMNWFEAAHAAAIEDHKERDRYMLNRVGIKPQFRDMSDCRLVRRGSARG